MRLGVLLDRFEPSRGGAEVHTDALLRRAVERGIEARLATLEGTPPAGVARVEFARPRGTRASRERAFARDGAKALRDAGCDRVLAVRHALDCDVYLPHGGLVDDARRARDDARGGSRLASRLADAFSARRRFFEEAERFLLAGPTGPVVVALSHALRARIVARYPAAKPRIVVVPNGVDVDRFDPAPFAASRPATRARLDLEPDAYVGLLLAHEPQLKGFATLLDVLARPEIRALVPSFRLVVAGRRAGPALLRAARRRGVAAAVRALGPVDDVRPLLAAADVLVQPTWHDPCSLTTLEALAMAVPVVTSVRNGASELMGMRGGIAIDDPADAAGFAKALEVLAEPRLRRETADDARYLAKRNRLATRLDALLDVCGRAGGPGAPSSPPPPPAIPADEPPQADPCLELPA